MKTAVENLIQELAQRGYRVTRARRKTLAAFVKLSQPISVKDLALQLVDIDEASVYRTVRMLVEEALLEEIALAGESPVYALAHDHHHHAVCSSCGLIEHVACELKKVPLSLPKNFNTIQSHEVTLYGLCNKCT